ncbi:MAG TPA: hypothetical protein VM030_02410 [Acidimicrobiales bacterium]|nr:hypothetical protein [Acidimicrobiales bacterium]
MISTAVPATSVGSLPHDDPAAAVDLVLATHPGLPAAPQLSARTPAEGMLAQCAAGLEGVTVDPRDGSLTVDVRRLDPGAAVDATFRPDAWSGLLAFVDRLAGETRPVKLQLAGPVTLGLALMAAGAPPDRAFGVALAAIRARGRAIVDLLAHRAPGLAPLVVLDEPGLVGVGRPGFPLEPTALVDLMSTAMASLGVRSGLHCCGETDWSLALGAGPDVAFIPVDRGVINHPAAVASFLEGGGWVAWGAVPTDGPVSDDPNRLWRQLTTLWCELVAGGCDPERLRTQAMVSPACGLAGHGESQAALVLRLSAALAERVQEQAAGVRLAVGA